MDPTEAFSTDRSTFDSELDLLMTLAPCSDSTAPATSPPTMKRTATQFYTPNKRIKTDGADNVHPSRRELLNSSVDEPPTDLLLRSQESQEGVRTGPNSIKLVTEESSSSADVPRSTYAPGTTWRTLANSVRRQWDDRKDDLEYDFLLEQRRKEILQNVDRYVPSGPLKAKGRTKSSTTFPLECLPDDVLARIFSYLLVGNSPISIDCYWLRSFVRGHARIPVVMQSAEVNGSTYAFPVDWNKLLKNVDAMKDDMNQFKTALEVRFARTKSVRSPCRGLSTALLRVSRKIHKNAAQVFYSKNKFRFPCATSAWIQLESFLATIGNQNSAKIQHLEVHAPMWHRTIQEDFVEGALLDTLSPATRMGVIQPPARDRLLSAIRSTVHRLAPTIKTINFELSSLTQADHWSGRYVNDKRLISIAEAEKHGRRKAEGMVLLKEVSKVMAERGHTTILKVARASLSGISRKELERQVPSIAVEAQEYGWKFERS